MGLFGFDSVKDMFDGGGAGQSGSSFSTEGSVFDRSPTYDDSGNRENNYVEKDQNYNADTTSFKDRLSNTNANRAAEQQNHIDQIVASNPNYKYEGNMIVDKETGDVIRDYNKDPLTDNEIGFDDGSSSSGSGASTGAASEYSPDQILEFAEKAGLVDQNEDIQAILDDPNAWLESRGLIFADIVPQIDPDAEGTTLDPTNPNYALGDMPDATATTGTATTAAGVNEATGTKYEAVTSADQLGTDATTVNAVTGEIRDENLVDAEQIDVEAAASGEGAVGEALSDYASIDLSMVLDTSTTSGKLLADKLRKEGKNYVDAKSSVLWQMKTIAAEFKDGNGNPVIPPWAQATARQVQRTMAFGDITGSAATAMMSQAIMEATLGIAEKEASFFQTLTIENLDNQQEAIINKANVIAQFETANLDARQQAAVENARAFLEMDLKNLTNEQQAEVINTQSMVDALFNDVSAQNAARLFGAEVDNDMRKFYDELTAQIQIHNSEQMNQMERFNVGEVNDSAEFMATLEDSRQRFYAEMQYNIDLATAKWRQVVETENTQFRFDAASEDIKNGLDISTESQNRMWDRVDNLLDYIFKGWNAEADRDATILAAQMQAQASRKSGGNSLFDGLITLGAAWLSSGSDMRLKENIEYYDTVQGIKYYTWDWTEEAKSIGWDKYPNYGVLAQAIQKTHPEAVEEGPDGYLMVNYGKIL